MAKRERAIQTEHQDKGPDEALSDRVSSASTEPSAVGALLRATRLRYGWDLEDVEVTLRIRLSHLEAIENGRFEDLPGAAYAVGFVRAYADYLGLDREDIVARFREEISDLPNRTQLNFPKPIPESRIPSGAILLIAAALAASVYGGWYYLTVGKRAALEPVAEVPQHLAQETPAEASNAPAPAATEAQATEAFGNLGHPNGTPPSGMPSSQPGPQPGPQPGEQTATASPAPSGVPTTVPTTTEPPTAPAPVASSAPAPSAPPAAAGVSSTEPSAGSVTPPSPSNQSTTTASANPNAAADESPSEEAPSPDVIVNEDVAGLPPVPEAEQHSSAAQVFGKANANARIVIRASADSWVQVRDGQGQLVLTRMLRAGDSYRVPNQPGLTLLTGNAGALEIFVDGRKVPPIGPGGAIRRDVALDADRLLQGNAVDY